MRGEAALQGGCGQMPRNENRGATAFRGAEGFGESAEIHRGRLLTHNVPIVVTIVDSAEAIGRLLPVLEEMIDTGLIAISDVEAWRVEKAAPTSTQ
jgi:uncharacterized protein